MLKKVKNLSSHAADSVPDGEGYLFGIVVADWNPAITEALLKGAIDTLKKYQVRKNDIKVIHVPGSFELTAGADLLASNLMPDAIICLGCVIQGETRHFEFICNAVANGLTQVTLDYSLPVIFGVLTTDTMQQAIDRSGGKHGNKGVESAITALKMAVLCKE